MSPDYSANANSQATPDYFLPQWMSSAPRLALPNQWPIEQFLSFLFCFTWFICLSAKKKSQTLSVKIIYGKPLCVRFILFQLNSTLFLICPWCFALCMFASKKKKKKKIFVNTAPVRRVNGGRTAYYGYSFPVYSTSKCSWNRYNSK